MKKNKENVISKLSRWLPRKRSKKIENTIKITLYVIAVGCILTGLVLGYGAWQVGLSNATIHLILLGLCILIAAGLLGFRHSIKNKLLQLILKNRTKVSQQVAKRIAHKSLNKSREWVLNGIQDGVETAQDLVDGIHNSKDRLPQRQKKTKAKTEIIRNALSLSKKSYKESSATASIPVTSAFEPALLCPACGRPQRVGARFCDGCGQPLPTTCPNCGISLRARAQFCDQCGQPVR